MRDIYQCLDDAPLCHFACMLSIAHGEFQTLFGAGFRVQTSAGQNKRGASEAKPAFAALEMRLRERKCVSGHCKYCEGCAVCWKTRPGPRYSINTSSPQADLPFYSNVYGTVCMLGGFFIRTTNRRQYQARWSMVKQQSTTWMSAKGLYKVASGDEDDSLDTA